MGSSGSSGNTGSCRGLRATDHSPCAPQHSPGEAPTMSPHWEKGIREDQGIGSIPNRGGTLGQAEDPESQTGCSFCRHLPSCSPFSCSPVDLEGGWLHQGDPPSVPHVLGHRGGCRAQGSTDSWAASQELSPALPAFQGHGVSAQRCGKGCPWPCQGPRSSACPRSVPGLRHLKCGSRSPREGARDWAALPVPAGGPEKGPE